MRTVGRSKRIRVSGHTRVIGGKNIEIKSYLRRMSARERTNRLSIARKEGISAENLVSFAFKRHGYQVLNITSRTNGAGDLYIVDENTGKIWLAEVKKINQWEYISDKKRRRGRIQVNKNEHKAMMRHAKQLDATPIYVVAIQTPSGQTEIKHLPTKTVSNYINRSEFREVKIPSALLDEEFVFEKFR